MFFYLYRFDGRRRFLNLGAYDPGFKTIENGKEIGSLAYHRNKYIEAKNKVAKGLDPLHEKVTAAAERESNPFMKELCSEYIKRHAMINKKSWELDEALIKREILPTWGKRKVADIRETNIKTLLNKIVERGAPVSANRVRSLIHMIFTYSVGENYIKENPCSKVKKPHKETPKERKLSADEIKQLWVALEGKGVLIGDQTKRVLKIILLTCQRPGEVVGMHEREIDGHWWTLPSDRTKNKREHRVYMTDTVLGLIGEYKGKGYIFPAGRGAEGHMTENSLSFALRRNIKGQSVGKDKVKRRRGDEYQRGPYKTEKPLPENPNRIGVDMFSPHDLRRSGATLMASIKVPFESRERVLNHTLSKMDSTYNLYDFDDEKQMAMVSLERKVLSIITAKESNVISITTGRKAA